MIRRMKNGGDHWTALQRAAAELAHHEQAYRLAFETLEAGVEMFLEKHGPDDTLSLSLRSAKASVDRIRDSRS